MSYDEVIDAFVAYANEAHRDEHEYSRSVSGPFHVVGVPLNKDESGTELSDVVVVPTGLILLLPENRTYSPLESAIFEFTAKCHDFRARGGISTTKEAKIPGISSACGIGMVGSGN